MLPEKKPLARTEQEDWVADEVMKDGTNVRETTLGNALGVNYGLIGRSQGRPPGAIHLMSGTGGASPGIGMEIFRRFVTFDVPHRTLLPAA